MDELPEVLEKLAGDSEILTSVETSENAAAAQELAMKDYAKASEESAKNATDAMEALSGNVKYGDLSDGAKQIFDQQKPGVQAVLDNINKLVDALDKDDKEPLNLTAGDGLPSPSSDDAEVARKGKKIQKAIENATNDLNSDTLKNLKDRIDDLESKATGERQSILRKNLKAIYNVITGVAGGLFVYGVLKKMAEDETGCYVSSANASHLLEPELIGHNCKDLSSICNCLAETSSNTTPSQINTKCGAGTADESKTCTNDYVYDWKKVTWFGALSDLMNGLINAAAASTEGVEGLIKWLTKNIKWVGVGAVILLILMIASRFIPESQSTT